MELAEYAWSAFRKLQFPADPAPGQVKMSHDRMAQRRMIMKAMGHELGRGHIRDQQHQQGHDKPDRPVEVAGRRRGGHRHRFETRRL